MQSLDKTKLTSTIGVENAASDEANSAKNSEGSSK
jgi:hypothetical protein